MKMPLEIDSFRETISTTKDVLSSALHELSYPVFTLRAWSEYPYLPFLERK
jgi:hypothetical protein